MKFISHLQQGHLPEVVTPSATQITVQQIVNYVRVERVIFRSAQTTPTYRSIYTAPSWAPESQRWRFQLGYLLRFILTARIDFSLPVRPPSWKEGERSEEHTSELQSLMRISYAVFCLKKKTKKTNNYD